MGKEKIEIVELCQPTNLYNKNMKKLKIYFEKEIWNSSAINLENTNITVSEKPKQ